jgi:hypothetical protein
MSIEDLREASASPLIGPSILGHETRSGHALHVLKDVLHTPEATAGKHRPSDVT